MANLPYSRTITLGPDDPIPSALLNELQDQAIGNKKPIMRRSIPLKNLDLAVGQLQWHADGYATFTGSSTGTVKIHVPFEVGDRVLGLECMLYGNGSVDVVHKLTLFDITVTPTLLVDDTDSNRAAAWGAYAPTTIPHVMATGEDLVWSMDQDAPTYRIRAAFLVYDR
jgi:hypothetical protein